MTMGRPRKPTKNMLSDNDKKKLWKKYRYLVVFLVRKYINCCQLLQLEDLIQEGYFGLIRAGELFKKKKGIKFSTYAALWIKQSIKRAIIKQDVQPRIPNYIPKDIVHYKDAKNKLERELDYEATIKEIAQKMGVSLERARRAKRMIESPSQKLSIDSLKDEENPHQELLVAEEKEKPWTPELESKDVLNSFLKKHLNQQEIIVIESKFLRKEGELIDKEIGKMIGRSGERVRQIRKKALEKLRQALKV